MAVRRFTLPGILCAAIAVISLSATRAAEPKPVSFKIVLSTTSNGFEARCEEGCVWKTLAYTCGAQSTSCSATIDQFGVEGATRDSPAR
jgi:hypothetical protein